MVSLRISESAYSVLETDLFELSEDPEAFGLDEQDAQAFATVRAHVRGTRLHIPASPDDCRTIAGVLCDMSNAYDDAAEDGGRGEEKRFCRNAAFSLAILSAKLESAAVKHA